MSHPPQRGVSQVHGPTTLSTASRPIHSVPDPKLSVVVVWTAEVDNLELFLEALLPQAARYGAEIVVAHARGREVVGYAKRFPGIRFVEPPDGSGTAPLRASGFAASDGDVVAITDPLAGPLPPGWLDQLVERRSLASRDSNA